MEALFHGIFELIKISILSCIYATLTLLAFIAMGHFRPYSWFDRASKDKWRIWVNSGLVIWVGLFFFMFTYWGNHGLGDSARIPIGQGIAVKNINWTEYAYIEDIKTCDKIRIEMTKFIVIEEKLIGNLESWFYSFKSSYFAYDMDKKELKEFYSLKEYNDFASKNDLPLANELRTFKQNYSDHWHGWRFWLLP